MTKLGTIATLAILAGIAHSAPARHNSCVPELPELPDSSTLAPVDREDAASAATSRGALVKTSPVPSPTRLSTEPVDSQRLTTDALRRKRLNGDVELIVSAPVDSRRFSSIYGRPPTAAESKELGSIAAAVPADAQTAKRSTDFAAQIKHANSDLVVVIGHNKDGMFVFEDGTRMSLQSMGEVCRGSNRVCVFLSCSSAAHLDSRATVGLQYDIAFDDALQLAREFRGRVKASSSPDVIAHDLQDLVAGMERRARVKYQVRYIVKSAGATAVVVGIVIVVKCILDDENCRL